MAKSSSVVDQQRLQDSIYAVEAKGGLGSLGELWDKAVVAYNSGKPAKLPPITKSVVMLRVREWNIPIRTKPGKKRGGPVTGGKKSGITVLVSLGDFKKRKIERGKGIGGDIESRPVICADKYNWILASEKPDGTFEASRSYLGSFRLLFSTVGERGEWSDDVPGKVCAKLAEITGKKLELNLALSPSEIGRQIDQFYKTSFCFHTDIFQRLFKMEAPEPEGEEDADVND